MKRTENTKDTTTMIAGWVFADLLLSLAVIFLATVSFHQGKFSSTSPSQISMTGMQNVTGVQNVNATNNWSGLTLHYNKFDANQIKLDLTKFFLDSRSSPSRKISHALVTGGYNIATQGSEKGSLTALNFIISLEKLNLANFKNAGIDISTSSNVKPNQIQLDLTFENK